jgi:hypothetical protein
MEGPYEFQIAHHIAHNELDMQTLAMMHKYFLLLLYTHAVYSFWPTTKRINAVTVVSGYKNDSLSN